MPYESYDAYRAITKDTIKERLVDMQLEFIKAEFAHSPNYKEALIDGDTVGIRFLPNDKDSFIAHVLIEPEKTALAGQYCVIDGATWLITDVVPKIISRASIQLCNEILRIQTGEDKTQIGTDPIGKPVYSIEPIYEDFRCIASNKVNSPYDNLNNPINLPEGSIRVSIPYVDIEHISDNTEFNMFGYTYKIMGIDNTKTQSNGAERWGVLTLVGQRVIRYENAR